MKRFHIHVSVEEPRMNFAISTGRQPVGVNHLGFQVDSADELDGMHSQLAEADAHLIEESERNGYEVIEPRYVPEEVTQSAEFRSLCPASAVCMAKVLDQPLNRVNSMSARAHGRDRQDAGQ